MEPRRLLAADVSPIQVGVVYFEDGSGEDEVGDVFEITFTGGAPGTRLTELVIETDKFGDGLSLGDAFFDTEVGGQGDFHAVGPSVVDQTGVDSVEIQVADGGTTLLAGCQGFDSGEKLVISIDVDERSALSANAVAEGDEFEVSRLSATFVAEHYFDATGTDVFLDEYDDPLASGLDLPNDAYVPPSPYMPPEAEPGPVYTAAAIFSVEQTPLPISIAGTVFEDFDLDNAQSPGEPGLAGVELTLESLEGGSYVPTGRTAMTDADGNYLFQDLLPAVYQIVETQPDGYFSVGASAGTVDGLTRGVVRDVDVIAEIALLGGEDSVDQDFAEAKPASLSGYVYHDADGDGAMGAGESGIGGVEVDLQHFPAGDLLMPPIVSTVTESDGSWSFEGLMPGEYAVAEVQPDGYFDGLDAAGTAGGVAHNPGDSIDGIRLNSGQAGKRYLFGEGMPASIGGRVHVDANGNCLFDPGEALLSDVTILLLNASGQIEDTTQTDAQGEYRFAGLRPGVYGVEEIQPQQYNDGADRVGSAGGRLQPPDSIVEVPLGSGVEGVGYDFCELPLSSIRGRVHVDSNDNGVYDVGEVLLEGVSVELCDASGGVLQTVQTDARGEYAFADLYPGVYAVREIQPQGYYDGPDRVGSAGGTLAPPDAIVDVRLPAATDAERYDFCEWEPASIRGRVHADLNANGRYDVNELLLAAVTIHLLDPSGNVVGTTRTDAAGEYSFLNLAPNRTYGVGEVQPDGYFDGPETVGSAGGSLLPPDQIIDAWLSPGTHAVGYDFCEIPPVSISGYVYADDNDNGLFEAGETGIAGVEVALLDGSGAPTGVTTVTDVRGFYRFEQLEPGTYGLSEVQPAGFFDGLDAAGSAGGAAHNPGDRITDVTLKPAVHGTEYNFGELRPASIGGRVHAELNGDCIPDPGEPLLADVTIHLLDADGNRIRATTTDARGEYVFGRLEPGTYGVEEIQPEGYLQGRTHVGSAGGRLDGPDRVVEVRLAPGAGAVEYDFCELVPATISGYVFQDGPAIVVRQGEAVPEPATVRDGRLTSDDSPIPGVVLQLGDGSGAVLPDADGQPITTVTDARGHYEFTMLQPGLYTVLEVHPERYVDGIDTPGTKGGIAVNPHEGLDPLMLSQLSVDPKNDAIIRIPIEAGDEAASYNFSEVLVEETPPFVPPPPDPPPVPPPPLPPPMPDPPTVLPLLPPPPPMTLRFPLDGSGGPLSYTWHLSVIDAGWPRRRRSRDDAALLSHDPYFDPVSWTGTDLGQSQWLIANCQGVPSKSLWFGLPGGIPVVGDFNGDGYDEVGVFLEGSWFLDLNGDGVWNDNDLWARLGQEGDLPVTGDWDGDGKTDIGIYGPAWPGDGRAIAAEPGLPDVHNQRTGRYKNIPPDPPEAAVGTRKMKRTLRGEIRSDLIDHVFQYGTEGDRPVAGDFNGDGVASIGVFRTGAWFLDVDGNGRWSPGDVIAEFGQAGDVPVVGDFTGDGIDDLGVYRAGTWHLDTNGNRRLDAHDKVFELGGPGDKPVVGDFDGDGVEEIAVYRDEAPPPEQQEAW